MGARTSTRSYLGLARRWRGPVSHGEHPETGHLQGQVLRREKGWTASQGKRGWAAGRGLNDKKTHTIHRLRQLGSGRGRMGTSSAFRSFRVTAGEAGLGNSPAAVPFLAGSPSPTHRWSLL